MTIGLSTRLFQQFLPSPLALNVLAPFCHAFRETPALRTHLQPPTLLGDRKNTAMHAQNALEFLVYQLYFEPLF